MARCETCGNEYDKAVRIMIADDEHVFDSLRDRGAGAALRQLWLPDHRPRRRSRRSLLLLRALRAAEGHAVRPRPRLSPMRYEEFVRYVERVVADGLDQERAERAIAATLTTLAECLPRGVARDLAAQLPPALQGPLSGGPDWPQPIAVGEFVGRVAEREQVSRSQAVDHVRAVLDALTEAVTGHELRQVRDCLPDKYETLFVRPAAAGWPQTHRPRPHP